MDGGVQTEFPKNGIRILFPESWGLGVPLHCGEYRNDVSQGYQWVSFVMLPPFSKRPIGANVKTLFWRWGFGKSVANIRSKNQHVFCRSDGVEKAGACLVDAVGIHLIKYFHRAGPAGAVTHTMCFLSPINRFDGIGPDEVKDRVIFLHWCRGAKTSLIRILVQLEIFRVLPVHPILLFQEFTACESHDAGRVLVNIARFDDVITLKFTNVGAAL